MNEWIIGIDLGTTNSLAASFQQGVPEVLRAPGTNGMTPSIVHFGSETVVGSKARDLAGENPQNTIYSAKRFLGKTEKDLETRKSQFPFRFSSSKDSQVYFDLGDRQLSPAEVSAEVLKEVKYQAEKASGKSVGKAVITVPAWFDDEQRQQTRLAAKLAGLEVVRLLNEPTAAALAYGLDQKKAGKILVYDLGGGTFDVSILELSEGVFRVMAVSGDTWLGGDDFDQALVQKILASNPEIKPNPAILSVLKFALEQAKIRLSEKTEVPLKIDFPAFNLHYAEVLHRADFEALIEPSINKTIKLCHRSLKDAGLKPEEITEVVLVGGSTRIPLVRKKIKEAFGKTPYVGLNPDEVVALGAAVQAHVLAGGSRDVLLMDVTPLSLGLETLGGAFSKIILRNTTVPVSQSDTFTTSVDNQTAITLHVLQGERELVEDCRSLAKFKIRVPPMLAGLPKLQVTFTVDENGMLTVSALEERSNQTAQIEICPTLGMSEKEMNRLVEESIDTAIEDLDVRMIVELRNKAKRILVALNQVTERAKNLTTKEEWEKIEEYKNKAQAALDGSEKDRIILQEIVDALGDLTRPLADRIFSQSTREHLTGKTLQEV